MISVECVELNVPSSFSSTEHRTAHSMFVGNACVTQYIVKTRRLGLFLGFFNQDYQEG